jgi:hypothetical protein
MQIGFGRRCGTRRDQGGGQQGKRCAVDHDGLLVGII